jgi:hypothetical protein
MKEIPVGRIATRTSGASFPPLVRRANRNLCLTIAICSYFTLLCPAPLHAQNCTSGNLGGGSVIQPPAGDVAGILRFANFWFEGSNCSWAVTSSQPWIIFQGASSGVSSSPTFTEVTIPWSISPNTTSSPRQAVLSLTFQGSNVGELQITQSSTNCAFSAAPLVQSAPAQGGNVTISVTSNPSGCHCCAN